MTYLRVTMPDGSKWDVPAEKIADHRANYYAKLDSERGIGSFDDVYQEEKKYALGSSFELIDWASNSMNWSEVAQFAEEAAVGQPEGAGGLVRQVAQVAARAP